MSVSSGWRRSCEIYASGKQRTAQMYCLPAALIAQHCAAPFCIPPYHQTLPHPTLPHPTIPHHTRSHPTPSHPTLPHPILTQPIPLQPLYPIPTHPTLPITTHHTPAAGRPHVWRGETHQFGRAWHCTAPREGYLARGSLARVALTGLSTHTPFQPRLSFEHDPEL